MSSNNYLITFTSYSVIDALKCEYMQNRVGDEFTGTITSVTSFGLFVELNDIYAAAKKSFLANPAVQLTVQGSGGNLGNLSETHVIASAVTNNVSFILI